MGDRSVDARALMAGVRKGVGLAADVAAEPDPAPGWQAVGLVLALQGGLALALTAYDTADPAAVFETGSTDGPARLAPVSVLLRRAGSPDHLSDPERVRLSRADQRALEGLMKCRNRQLHPLEPPLADDELAIASGRAVAVRVLRHLLFEAPAFDPGRHALDLAQIRDQLRRLD